MHVFSILNSKQIAVILGLSEGTVHNIITDDENQEEIQRLKAELDEDSKEEAKERKKTRQLSLHILNRKLEDLDKNEEFDLNVVFGAMDRSGANEPKTDAKGSNMDEGIFTQAGLDKAKRESQRGD
jgi:hypothetical protein